MKRKVPMKNLARLMCLAGATTILAQQQTLPSAPDPKPSPSPFKFPAKAQPVPPAASGTDKNDNEKKHHEEGIPGISDLLAEPLEARQQLILKEYLSNRLVQAVRSCWVSVMPEEARGKHRPFHLDKKGKSGKVRVAFTLHKDGSMTDAAIEDSSGDKVLDQAALNAVKDCRPPPLPSAFARETLKMHFWFYYNP
jgi:TonB family protein